MELGMLSDFSDQSVARCDVPLSYLMEVFVSLFANLEFRSNVSSKSLVMLNNVDVNDVFGEELPCQSKMVSSLGRWSEVELTIVFFVELSNGLDR